MNETHLVILKNLVMVYENDFCNGDEEVFKKYNTDFLTLIMYLTRLVNNISYCSNRKCPCSAESHIKQLVNKLGVEIHKIIPKYPLTEVNGTFLIDELRKIGVFGREGIN